MQRDLAAPRKVGPSRTFPLRVEGRGMAFRPAPGNRGGFPLHLKREGDTLRVHVVENGGVWWPPEGLGAFEVDTAPGGGVAGDQWEVTLYEAERFEPRASYSQGGAVATARPGVHTLFSFNGYENPEPLVAAKALNKPQLWIRPDAADAFSAEPGPAWDLSPYTRVLVTVAMGYSAPPDAMDELYLFLDGCAESAVPNWGEAVDWAGNYAGMPLCYANNSLGSLQSLTASNGTTRFGFIVGQPHPKQASSEEGAGQFTDGSNLTHWPTLPPYARFCFSNAPARAPGAPFIDFTNTLYSKPGQILVTAVAW